MNKFVYKLTITFLLLQFFGRQHNIFVYAEDDEDEHTFVPTNEWQVVKKGQILPKGLHVRINLESGKTEAKLDTSKLSKTKALTLSETRKHKENDVEISPDEKVEKFTLPPEELKQLLKNIKADDSIVQSSNSIKGKFKSYEQLKEELVDINLSVKSDAELIHDLFKQLQHVHSDTELKVNKKNEKILYILQDLEYLVHQIDNANTFIDLNGFTEVIYKHLNWSEPEIKCESLNIFGSCVQNNAKAQIHAFETGATNKLLKIFALDKDVKVKKRAVYALSNLVRRFPLAQKVFIQDGGLNIFISHFEQNSDTKLYMKVITLIYDLLMEDLDARQHSDIQDYAEKLRQYDSVNLRSKLNELGWCKLLSTYFVKIFSGENEDHDFLERYINLMLLLSDICHATYKDAKLRNILQELHNNYKLLAIEEEQENIQEKNAAQHSFYFKNIKNLISELLQNLSVVKTEL